MRNKLIILLFIILLLAFSVSAIKVYETECYDDGSIKLTLKANSEKDAYTKDMIILADEKRVKGSWDNTKLTLRETNSKYATFTGLENQLIEKKSYAIKISYKERLGEAVEDAELSFDLECPGLLFTCEKLGIKIKDCVTSKTGKFSANLDIYGLEQSKEGEMDPLKVIDYVLETQILYKDISNHVSKKGSLPKGATITKTADNQYLIEANFGKYTTNHVETMWTGFNNNLVRPCDPTKYPSIILSYKQGCEYKETEEDVITWQKEQEEKQNLITGSLPEIKKPVEELKKSLAEEIYGLELRRTEIETKLNELYKQREEQSPEEEKEEEKPTGYSIKESGSSNKKTQLKIMLVSLLAVILIGGSLLAYLYKRGYFY